jgi:hypothetical protein
MPTRSKNAQFDRPKLSPAAANTKWERHEHEADLAQTAAQKLVDATGSVELAKQALENAREPPAEPERSRDAFAQQQGFASYLEMFEAAEPITGTDHAVWLVAVGRSTCVVWNERDLHAIHFTNHDDAVSAIESGSVSRVDTRRA